VSSTFPSPPIYNFRLQIPFVLFRITHSGQLPLATSPTSLSLYLSAAGDSVRVFFFPSAISLLSFPFSVTSSSTYTDASINPLTPPLYFPTASNAVRSNNIFDFFYEALLCRLDYGNVFRPSQPVLRFPSFPTILERSDSDTLFRPLPSTFLRPQYIFFWRAQTTAPIDLIRLHFFPPHFSSSPPDRHQEQKNIFFSFPHFLFLGRLLYVHGSPGGERPRPTRTLFR